MAIKGELFNFFVSVEEGKPLKYLLIVLSHRIQ